MVSRSGKFKLSHKRSFASLEDFACGLADRSKPSAGLPGTAALASLTPAQRLNFETVKLAVILFS
jgi:hypothetical protein